jgi:hypothetical protein
MHKTRHLAVLSAGFCLAAALAASGSDVFFLRGYLPVIGPEPLRFRSSEPLVQTFLTVPPAPVKADSAPTPPLSEQAEPENPFALTESLAPAADTNATIMEAVSPPPAYVPIQPIPSGPAVPALPSSDQPISPSVFLQYFNNRANLRGATNAVGGASVNFTPPHAQIATPAPASANKALNSTAP